MADQGGMSKETFLSIAETAGLDVKDEAHMDELYAFVQGVIPGLKAIYELDVTGVEPATTFAPSKE